MTGTSKLEANGFTINDSLGNNNGIVNRAECVNLNLGVKNNGCATETAISATLTTTTPGVTVVDGNSSYPDMAIDASGTNTTPFKISVSDTFACGTEIALSLNLTYASGSKSISFTVPTCAGGPDQTIPPSQITTSDSTQPDRMGRDGRPSTCSGKTCPGPINTAGTAILRPLPLPTPPARHAALPSRSTRPSEEPGTSKARLIRLLTRHRSLWATPPVTCV